MAGIVRRFVATTRVSGTACAARNPALHLVAAFPLTSATAPAAKQGAGDATRPAERRAAWCAAQAVSDAIARYNLIPGTRGVGLRGGRFTVRGLYLESHPVTLRLIGARFCSDVAVSGTATWHRTSGAVHAKVRFGAARARLSWSLSTVGTATLRGSVSPAGDPPRPLRLTLPAA